LIGCGAVFLLFSPTGFILRTIAFIAALFFTQVNGSKVVLISLVIALLFWGYITVTQNKLITTKMKFLLKLIIVTSVVFLMFLFFEFVGQIKVGSYTLLDLLVEPIIRIFTLEPYGLGAGSLTVRTDMTIFAIKDFMNSFGLGIGFGNSLAMIESERYGVILEGAKTLHNFPLQVVLELGGLVVTPLFYFLLKEKSGKTKVLFILLLVMSLSQSAGVFSNYFFLCIISYILCVDIDSKPNNES